MRSQSFPPVSTLRRQTAQARRLSARLRDILADQSGIDAILKDGAERADAIAAPIMEEVRRAVGYWRP